MTITGRIDDAVEQLKIECENGFKSINDDAIFYEILQGQRVNITAFDTDGKNTKILADNIPLTESVFAVVQRHRTRGTVSALCYNEEAGKFICVYWTGNELVTIAPA